MLLSAEIVKTIFSFLLKKLLFQIHFPLFKQPVFQSVQPDFTETKL
jgi:hypothetical protein